MTYCLQSSLCLCFQSHRCSLFCQYFTLILETWKVKFAMYFWRPSFNWPNYTSNWLCSKLLATYLDRGDQDNHFWHFLFLLSFLSQLSSAQQRDVSARFYNNIFYSQWPPLTDKTTKKNFMCPHLIHRLSDLLLKCQNKG